MKEIKSQKQNPIEEKNHKQATQSEVTYKNIIKELNYNKLRAKMDEEISQIEENYRKGFEKRDYLTMKEIR